MNEIAHSRSDDEAMATFLIIQRVCNGSGALAIDTLFDLLCKLIIPKGASKHGRPASLFLFGNRFSSIY